MKNRLIILAAIFIAAHIALKAQWTRTNGPSGGSIYAIAAEGPNLVATAWDQALYRFDGNEWSRILGIHPDHVFASESVFFASMTDAMFRSTDHGATWNEVGLSGGVVSIASNGTAIYATNYQGLYKSTTNGLSWDWVENQPGHYVYMHTACEGTIYVASADSDAYMKYYRSTDNGENWVKVSDGLPTDDYSYAMACSGSDVYLGYTQKGVYHSSNKGVSWSTLNNGLMHDDDDINITQLVIVGQDVFASTPSATYRLKGNKWEMIADQQFAVLAGSVTGETSTLVMGSADGVSRLASGNDLWESLNTTLRVHDINDMITQNDKIFAATPAGIFRSDNGGNVWEHMGPLEAMTLAGNGTTLFARMGSWTGIGLMRSTDAGTTWTQSVEGITASISDIDAVATSDNSVFVGVGNYFSNADTGSWFSGGVYRSTNEGADWKLVDGLPRSEQSPVPVMALAANGTTVVAYSADGVYSSTDDGNSWAKTLDILVMQHPAPAIKFGGGRFYIGIDDTLYSSADAKEWIVEDLALPTYSHILDVSFVGSIPVVAVAPPFFGPQRPAQVVIARIGSTWTDISEKFPADLWFSRVILYAGMLYGGTYGNSIWKTSQSSVFGPSSAVENRTHGTLRLKVSPNPIVSEATITFGLDRQEHVTLVVTNALGEVVATLLDETMEAGEHTIRHDASAIPEGAWFYRLTTDSVSEIGKIIKAM